MKNIILPMLMLILACLLIGDLINPDGSFLMGDAQRNTEGSLAFSVRTATYNGAYAPRNAGVIWITNAQNQFVKTIKIWANSYRYTLIRWIASSGQNTTGAVTSASYNTHQLHNITWNGRNYQNQEMPDGEYKINIEFTEHNASAANLGKYKQVVFAKGPAPIDITIPNETYFRDMHLVWTPVIVNGSIFGTVMDATGSPFSGVTVSAGSYSVNTNAEGVYSISMPPGTYYLSCNINGYQAYTSDVLEVISGQDLLHDVILQPVSNEDVVNAHIGLAMKKAYPNPFISTSSFSYRSERQCTMDIYNLKGQLVYRKSLPASKHSFSEISWDGRSDNGTRCASGIYSIVLSDGQQKLSQRVLLRK